MNGLPYYKAYPRDFIEGTIGMSFELKGAYRLVLDLIYMQGGDLPDDDRYISGLLGCTIRKWKTMRNELVASGKLQVNGESLTNERAVFELETLRKLGEKQSENRSRPNKNKEINSPRLNHTEADTEADKTTLSSVVRAQPQDDFDLLQTKMLEAIGEGNIQPHGAMVVGPIVELLSAGVSLELDILPTLKARSAKITRPAGSWAYFVQPIREAYERRVNAGRDLPKPKELETSDEAWNRRLRLARSRQQWSSAEWGPMPGARGCNVPARLLEPSDGQGWTEPKEARHAA